MLDEREIHASDRKGKMECNIRKFLEREIGSSFGEKNKDYNIAHFLHLNAGGIFNLGCF